MSLIRLVFSVFLTFQERIKQAVKMLGCKMLGCYTITVIIALAALPLKLLQTCQSPDLRQTYSKQWKSDVHFKIKNPVSTRSPQERLERKNKQYTGCRAIWAHCHKMATANCTEFQHPAGIEPN